MAPRKKKKQKKSDTQRMNDVLREKAGVTAEDEEVKNLYLEGLESLNEFMDEVIADAEERAAQAAENDNQEAVDAADEGETAVGELGEAFLEIYEALGEALGVETIDEDGGGDVEEEE